MPKSRKPKRKHNGMKSYRCPTCGEGTRPRDGEWYVVHTDRCPSKEVHRTALLEDPDGFVDMARDD